MGWDRKSVLDIQAPEFIKDAKEELDKFYEDVIKPLVGENYPPVLGGSIGNVVNTANAILSSVDSLLVDPLASMIRGTSDQLVSIVGDVANTGMNVLVVTPYNVDSTPVKSIPLDLTDIPTNVKSFAQGTLNNFTSDMVDTASGFLSDRESRFLNMKNLVSIRTKTLTPPMAIQKAIDSLSDTADLNRPQISSSGYVMGFGILVTAKTYVDFQSTVEAFNEFFNLKDLEKFVDGFNKKITSKKDALAEWDEVLDEYRKERNNPNYSSYGKQDLMTLKRLHDTYISAYPIDPTTGRRGITFKQYLTSYFSNGTVKNPVMSQKPDWYSFTLANSVSAIKDFYEAVIFYEEQLDAYLETATSSITELINIIKNRILQIITLITRIIISIQEFANLPSFSNFYTVSFSGIGGNSLIESSLKQADFTGVVDNDFTVFILFTAGSMSLQGFFNIWDMFNLMTERYGNNARTLDNLMLKNMNPVLTAYNVPGVNSTSQRTSSNSGNSTKSQEEKKSEAANSNDPKESVNPDDPINVNTSTVIPPESTTTIVVSNGATTDSTHSTTVQPSSGTITPGVPIALNMAFSGSPVPVITSDLAATIKIYNSSVSSVNPPMVLYSSILQNDATYPHLAPYWEPVLDCDIKAYLKECDQYFNSLSAYVPYVSGVTINSKHDPDPTYYKLKIDVIKKSNSLTSSVEYHFIVDPGTKAPPRIYPTNIESDGTYNSVPFRVLWDEISTYTTTATLLKNFGTEEVPDWKNWDYLGEDTGEYIKGASLSNGSYILTIRTLLITNPLTYTDNSIPFSVDTTAFYPNPTEITGIESHVTYTENKTVTWPADSGLITTAVTLQKDNGTTATVTSPLSITSNGIYKMVVTTTNAMNSDYKITKNYVFVVDKDYPSSAEAILCQEMPDNSSMTAPINLFWTDSSISTTVAFITNETNPVIVNDVYEQLSGFSLTTTPPTATGFLYWELKNAVDPDTNDETRTFVIYSNKDMSTSYRVGSGSRTGDGVITILEENSSGLSGSVTVAYAKDTRSTNNLITLKNTRMAYKLGTSLRFAGDYALELVTSKKSSNQTNKRNIHFTLT